MRKAENREQRMENGEKRKEKREWRMENGEWRKFRVKNSNPNRYTLRLFLVSCWRMVCSRIKFKLLSKG
ncbi:hypothetical protein FGM00_04300 [Aggregatimonas sangjinii]|uniref:Uncharacterized protein n=1 Tax=Aggregatimonas sangjinii TaxID=2583587 RepID=A0A5B7SPQ2_9FLAO|nr:hypothetical protein FGM00_04300 [Aggregatimonas sangjinii]